MGNGQFSEQGVWTEPFIQEDCSVFLLLSEQVLLTVNVVSFPANMGQNS